MSIEKIFVGAIIVILLAIGSFKAFGIDDMLANEMNKQNQTALCQSAKQLTTMADCNILGK